MDATEGQMKLILFDIDGTLLKNGNPIQIDSYRYAIRQVFGIEGSLQDIVPDGKVDSQIFIEILSHRKLPPAQARQQLGQLFSARHQYLEQNMQADQSADVLPGVVQLLLALQGRFLLGVLTGNEEQSAWHRLERADLKDFFTLGAFGNESEQRADLVQIAIGRAEALAHQRFSPTEVLLVGDTPKDVDCAKANGVHVLGVATGIYSPEELREADPDAILADLTQISAFQQVIQ